MTQSTLNFPNDSDHSGETTTSSSREVSHANHSALLEEGWERKMNAIYGPRCLGSSEKSNPPTSWARMFVDSLVGMKEWYSTRCSLIWKVKATKSNRLYFQLQASTRHTSEREYGSLLPTPTVYDYNSARTPEKWEEDKKKWAAKGVDLQMPLKQMARLNLLPTPTATDYKGAHPPTSIDNFPARRGSLRNVYIHVDEPYHSTNSQLSPRFAAEMMGFPPDWTELPFLLGEDRA